MDLDILAIAVTELLGVVFFISALLFLKWSKKMGTLQEELKRKAENDKRSWEPCYSYKWVMNRTLKSRSPLGQLVHSIGIGGFLMIGMLALGVFISITLLVIFCSAGYSLLIALTGGAILFETDAFEAYSYSRALRKVGIDQLVEEDQGYMETAMEVLKMAALRSLIVGVIFVVAGPFIPYFLYGLSYALAYYMECTLFPTVGSLQRISKFVSMFVGFILVAVLLYLPELISRILFRKVKKQIRKMF